MSYPRALILTAAMAAFLPNAALAASHEIAIEVGNLHNGDRTYDRFSYEDTMPSYGLAAGFAFHDRLALIGGWHHIRRGADLTFGGEFLARQALFANDLSLGVKGDVPWGDYVATYVSLNAVGMHATVKVDDDPNDEQSPGQVQASGLAVGARAAGGVQVRIPKDRWFAPVTAAFHIEAGYELLSRLQFGDMGSMKPGGFALRTGVGIQF